LRARLRERSERRGNRQRRQHGENNYRSGVRRKAQREGADAVNLPSRFAPSKISSDVLIPYLRNRAPNIPEILIPHNQHVRRNSGSLLRAARSGQSSARLREPGCPSTYEGRGPYNASAEITQTLTDATGWRWDSKATEGSGNLHRIIPSLASSRVFRQRPSLRLFRGRPPFRGFWNSHL